MSAVDCGKVWSIGLADAAVILLSKLAGQCDAFEKMQHDKIVCGCGVRCGSGEAGEH